MRFVKLGEAAIMVIALLCNPPPDLVKLVLLTLFTIVVIAETVKVWLDYYFKTVDGNKVKTAFNQTEGEPIWGKNLLGIGWMQIGNEKVWEYEKGYRKRGQ